MGIFDSFMADIAKEVKQAANTVDIVKAGAAKIVDAIDSVEEKVNNLPDEQQVKDKIASQFKSSTSNDNTTTDEQSSQSASQQ